MHPPHPSAVMVGGGLTGFDAARNANAPPRAVNPSCFGTVEGAMAECSQTSARVVRMIDRLIGAAPEPTSGQNANDPSGLFDVASRQALAIRDDMLRINSALDRLESQLP